MRMQVQLGNVQTVTPQMIASMTVLQCGAQELKEYLEELSYENPMMDLQEPEQTGTDQGQTDFADRLRWLRGSDRQNSSYYTDADRDSVDQYLHIRREMCLSDFVKEQILTLSAPPDLRCAMETVADLLDERGLYPGDPAEIAWIAGCGLGTAEAALRQVRCLEPAGVAAPSIQASLLVQMEAMEPRRPLAERLVSDFYSHLGTWSDQRLAKEMGVPEGSVQAAKRIISGLNPYPGNGFSGQEDIQYITPDLYVHRDGQGLRVTAEEQYLPSVHINPDYLQMLETETDPEVRKYLKQKLVQLEQVIHNVGRRKSTLLRCGEVIARRQERFFQGGVLQKLTLKDVAEELELHESTVSRAVKNKFIQCERGIFPMSHFFSRDAGQNYGVCRGGIQSMMAEIIDGEDKRKPLSDEKIVAELSRRHIVLSRRAVAKYRVEMGIPTASARKHLA